MKNSAFLFLILFLGLSACSKKEDTILPEPFPERLVNLSSLKVGQQSIYLKYETNCENYEQDFAYTGDTLILEVVDKAGALSLSESYTEHSPLYLAHDFNQEARIYPVEQQDKLLFLRERNESALFFFYGNDTLQVEPIHSTFLSQSGCFLMQNDDPFIGNDIGWLERLHVGDIIQKEKTVVSCVPNFELDAYLIYDKNQLYQSHTVNIVEFNGQIIDDLISGWVLLK